MISLEFKEKIASQLRVFDIDNTELVCDFIVMYLLSICVIQRLIDNQRTTEDIIQELKDHHIERGFIDWLETTLDQMSRDKPGRSLFSSAVNQVRQPQNIKVDTKKSVFSRLGKRSATSPYEMKESTKRVQADMPIKSTQVDIPVNTLQAYTPPIVNSAVNSAASTAVSTATVQCRVI